MFTFKWLASNCGGGCCQTASAQLVDVFLMKAANGVKWSIKTEFARAQRPHKNVGTIIHGIDIDWCLYYRVANQMCAEFSSILRPMSKNVNAKRSRFLGNRAVCFGSFRSLQAKPITENNIFLFLSHSHDWGARLIHYFGEAARIAFKGSGKRTENTTRFLKGKKCEFLRIAAMS